ncbi:putative immunity protein [Chitinophaga arvensicola]|uniref:Imm-5-like domain-containing protein n=1 Tax=Chitinophaga arvensicola TaxID=29529 RepID=A0A1I0RGU8_9BACT|nr:hypothetical protein [Chitinophaga arvensicola]SEW40095.1 hypothetical protein SAMN04488122_2816 [Chitinophaga arvensicola]
MRDKRFVALHRGGPLTKERHVQLIQWAHDCVSHILPLWKGVPDERLTSALATAREWATGKASVGDARNAALAAIAVANETIDPVGVLVARAVGHAVATAHMTDHCLRAAAYARKAATAAGRSVAEEIQWQEQKVPAGVRDLVPTPDNV